MSQLKLMLINSWTEEDKFTSIHNKRFPGLMVDETIRQQINGYGERRKHVSKDDEAVAFYI